MQSGQQAALALTLNSLNLDICCLSETRIQDSSRVIDLKVPSQTTCYKLRTSGDVQAAAAGQAGVGIVLSSAAESALLNWIPVNSRLCAIRIASGVGVSVRRSTKRSLFVISAYAPTNCSSDTIKDEFYDSLRNLLNLSRSSDIVILTGDFNAQVGLLGENEQTLGGRYGIDSPRSDNGERLLQLCGEYNLFLSSTSFRNKPRRYCTWYSPATSTWSQIDHIAISYRWRGCIQGCRSYWSTYVDTDHALVFCRFSLQFDGEKVNNHSRLATVNFNNSNVKESYQKELTLRLASINRTDVTELWEQISNSMTAASRLACGQRPKKCNKH